MPFSSTITPRTSAFVSRVRFLVASASGIVNQVGEKKSSDVAAAAAIPAIVAARMTVVGNGQLRAAIGQIRDADFFGALLDDVIDTAQGHRRQIFAVGIARPVLDGAGHAHVPLGLREPWRNLRVVNRPVFAEPVEIGGLEIDVAEARRGASPEIGFAAGCLASLPVPVGTRRVGISDVVLEQVSAFAVFGLFDRVRLLMRLAFEAQADRRSRDISSRKLAGDGDSPSRDPCADLS